MENTALDILKDTQEALNLNQKQFGTYIGVSIRTISNWMTGVRQCPIYIAEMAARLAESDLRALDQAETPSGMFRWCVISSKGMDEWVQPCGSKADALRQAESDWNHLTAKEKENQERFMVGVMHVCYEPGYDGPFNLYTREDGSCDGDVYEVAKDYLA